MTDPTRTEPSSAPSSGPLSCVLLGEESLLIQCAELWRARGHQILTVVSQAPDIVRWAESLKLPVTAPGADLSAYAPDYVLSITNLRILKEDTLSIAKKAAINFHDGPLPAYAGMYTPVWALLQGETQYGISFHVISGGIDEGDILAERSFDLDPGETSLTLNTKNYANAIDAFGQLVRKLEAGDLSGRKQDLSQRRYYGKYDRPEAACVLDLEADAARAERLVRALDFGRYENPVGVAKLMHGQRAVRVGAASAQPAQSDAQPGTVLEATDDQLTVATGDGLLSLRGLATLGGAPLSAAEALDALGARVGERLAGPDAQTRERLGAAHAQVCRGEARWAARLAALDGIDVPYLRAADASGDRSSVSVAVDPAWLRAFSAEVSGGELLAGLSALYLARLCGRDSLDVGLSHPTLRATAAVAPPLFCEQVPMQISLEDRAQPLRNVLGAQLKELSRCLKRGPYLQEIAQRFPALTGRGELRRGELLPVAIVVADGEPAQAAAPRGTRLCLQASADGSELRLDYDPASLSADDAARMAEQLRTFLAAGAAAPDAPFCSLSLLSEAERRVLLEEWNATARDYPRDSSIVAELEKQVQATPDAVAVVCEGDSLTYRELNARANQLAHHLRSLGVGKDRMVGVHTPRSIDMLVGALGVMKAGGAYLPLDPAYPAERVAFMLEDAEAAVVLTHAALRDALPATDSTVLCLDEAFPHDAPRDNLPSKPAPEDLAYVIYTSGSTGRPKGVMVEHRNVLNFFAGMDERVPHDPPGVWLAVTSLSFDISVLELHWTLCRGFKVVLHVDRERHAVTDQRATASGDPLNFGIFLWGNDDASGPDKYDLMLECARFADDHGFTFVSTPERHFHAFGGPFPNPAVTGAALATVTHRVQIRSGSCVLPLHHPVRVAEEWSVVDNLSRGRVGVAFAAGWQPNDFVLRPESFKGAKQKMFENIEVVKRLWRGEAVAFENPMGDMVPCKTLPRPVQGELPVWVTTAGNVETFELAGRAGAHLLTHLLGQSLDEVADKIAAYRRAREQAGYDPHTGKVTLMLHTFIGDDEDEVREIVRQPMKDYLGASVTLIKGFAWSFPAFRRPEGTKETDDVSLDHLTAEEMDALLDHAFERYYQSSGLFGTPERCHDTVAKVTAAGVDEIACLLDYGVPLDQVRASLPLLAGVVAETQRRQSRQRRQAESAETADYSIPALIEAHGVTHLQCTPSMAKMLVAHDESREALRKVRHMMVGGEALPLGLAHALDDVIDGTITNMYGPTETTIWSSTERVDGKPDAITIGKPIANTQLYVVDRDRQPCPPGVPGELLIGGDGVVRGYHKRPELTAERFVEDTISGRPGARLYRTGDLARHLPDGRVEFLGRLDFQVKIRGYRIELGEIETRLAALPGVRECAVVAREDSDGNARLVAYVVPDGAAPPEDTLRRGLRADLPEFMVPSVFVSLDRFPLTPNGKLDRKALPAPEAASARKRSAGPPPANDLERSVAEIWQQVLELDSVGRTDNFFDLGGHSLLVVQAHRALKEKLGRPISLTDMYRFPTIETLVAHLSDTGGDDRVSAAKARGERRRGAARRRKLR